jgi:diadenosine tetraphosphate (Ap4A) HIT family hydrolase
MPFTIDPQLAADTVPLGDFALSHVRLMTERHYPWLVLVPMRTGVRELIELTPFEQAALTTEIDRASRALTALFRPDKLNIGAIGNIVSQLHVHIVARFRTDPAWPKPVWGAALREAYDADALAERAAALRTALKLGA